MPHENPSSDLVLQEFGLSPDGYNLFTMKRDVLRELKGRFAWLIETSVAPRCEILDITIVSVAESMGHVVVLGTRDKIKILLKMLSEKKQLDGQLGCLKSAVQVEEDELVEV
jgi:hypothetical protein